MASMARGSKMRKGQPQLELFPIKVTRMPLVPLVCRRCQWSFVPEDRMAGQTYAQCPYCDAVLAR